MKEHLNVAVIGLGQRGIQLIDPMLKMDDVTIVGVCDTYDDRTENAAKIVEDARGNIPLKTADYNEILNIEGLDVTVIATSWEKHVEIAVASMCKGIYTAMEVGGTYDLHDCFDLVRCALLRESEYGILKNIDTAVLFVLGSSLGCAAKIDGKLLSGTTGQAGAMFFMPEKYSENEYVYDTLANSIKLTKLYDSNLTRGNMRLLSERKSAHDEMAAVLLQDYAKAVALKCWYAYLAYDPTCIVLCGGIANDAEIFEDIYLELKKFFEMDLSGRRPTVLNAEFGENSNLLGAALL